MLKIRSAPLSGIQDNAILNALRVMQENIEAIAGAQDSKAVPVTEEKFSKQIGALNDTIASLRKQIQAQTVVPNSPSSSSTDTNFTTDADGGISTTHPFRVYETGYFRDGLFSDTGSIGAPFIHAGNRLKVGQYEVADELAKMAAYIAAHP